jgi:alcohol dehydrogenase (NADP+)
MLYTVLLSAFGLLVFTSAQELPRQRQLLEAIPQLGLGTFGLTLSQSNTTEVIADAIQMGYRHIDAAAIYENEDSVGLGIAEGLRRTGLRREDIWVTTKLWNDR